VRALLDLMRENEAVAQNVAALCEEVLERARLHLKVLDPEVGDKELIKEVEVEALKLRS
jgi:hypothetical protein